jgi:histone deacetylase 11
MPRIVYSPNYNIRLLGLERLHPFDARKYEKVWELLEEEFGAQLETLHESPKEPASFEDLAQVHLPEHLAMVQSSAGLAKAFEIGLAAYMPNFWLQSGLVAPIRWAVAGTALAGRLELEHRLAINLGGGFHHAKPHKPEGFCLFNEVALAVHILRREEKIAEDDIVAYIDLDAHQGNGVTHCFLNDRQVKILDVFNADVYPNRDEVAKNRIDVGVPLDLGTGGGKYLHELRRALPRFLDLCQRNGRVAIAFCNLGADVLLGDPLGALSLTPDELLERDELVVDALSERSIPTVTTASGGYAKDDFRTIAQSLTRLLERD